MNGRLKGRVTDTPPNQLQSWRHRERALDILKGLRALSARSAAHWRPAKRLQSLAAELRTLSSRERGLRSGELIAARARIRPALAELRVLRASPATFNPFLVLRLARREYVHSNVLAWLCDPYGNHGLGPTFLNRVLGEVGLPEVSAADAASVRVTREHVGDTSIVDLSISTSLAFLFIENKVDSEEGEDQTAREYADFQPRAGARECAAVFLTPTGESPARPEFVAWSYETIWRLLGDLSCDARVAQFLFDYRKMVAEDVLEGRVVTNMKELRPETRFVLEHRDDVLLLQEAMAAAEADFAQILTMTLDSLAEREWWDEESWEGKLEGRKGLYVFKKSWKTGDNMFCFGLDGFTWEALTDGKKAWSYAYLPDKARKDPSCVAKLHKAAKAANLSTEGTRSEKFPFWRHLGFDGVGSDLAKIQSRILTEMDALSALIPCFDELAGTKK